MSKTRIRQLTKFILFNVFVVILAFILFEGVASTILLVQDLWNTRPVAERAHTKYDPQIGWVNIPETYIAEMYGPGLYVKINSQGFRNNEEFSVEVPQDKVRLICTGDSFTFGFGVNNDQTWCHLLSVLDQRFQTVNMGQGGYDLGQAYLWYKRDGDRVAHDVQLFAFITTDFDRMQYDQFLGYGKPVLTVENDELVTRNIPVPRRAFYVPLLTQGRGSFEELRSVTLLRRSFFEEASLAPAPILDEEAVQRAFDHIVRDLQRINQARDSQLVLVYLPIQADYEPGSNLTDLRQQYVQQAAGAYDLPLIDLVDEFRQLSPEEMNELFIPYDESIGFPEAAGHYSTKGNEYIANLLYTQLLAQPEISDMLGLKKEVVSQSP